MFRAGPRWSWFYCYWPFPPPLLPHSLSYPLSLWSLFPRAKLSSTMQISFHEFLFALQNLRLHNEKKEEMKNKTTSVILEKKFNSRHELTQSLSKYDFPHLADLCFILLSLGEEDMTTVFPSCPNIYLDSGQINDVGWGRVDGDNGWGLVDGGCRNT